MGSTAGKGPGIVLRPESQSGTVRLSLTTHAEKAALQVLDLEGSYAEIKLNVRELRALARAIDKAAQALSAAMSDEITQG